MAWREDLDDHPGMPMWHSEPPSDLSGPTPGWDVGGPIRILLVEDDASMRKALTGMIRASGLECASFESAEALLDRGPAPGDGCVVSDLMLPALSGLDLLDRMRAQGGWPPLILITAHDRPGLAGEATRRGASAYLVKPFRGTTLMDAIRATLKC